MARFVQYVATACEKRGNLLWCLFVVSEKFDRILSQTEKEIAYWLSINVWLMTCEQQHLARAFKFNPILHQSSANLRANWVESMSVDIIELSNMNEKIISRKLTLLKNCLILRDGFFVHGRIEQKIFSINS